jgi:hypothetical protein
MSELSRAVAIGATQINWRCIFMTDQIDPGAAGSVPSVPPTQPLSPATAATATAQPSWFGKALAAGKAFFTPPAQQGRALTPAPGSVPSTVPSNQELAAEIEEISITSDMPLEMIVAMLSGETQDVKEVIDGLQEDKETWIGWILGRIVTIVCYVLPWIISAYAGSALGQHYAGSAFAWNNAGTAYYYIVSWGYEFALVALMTAMVRVFKRLANGSGRSAGVMLAVVLTLFLVLASTSAAAQWILFEKNINMADPSQVIGALFRTLATPLIDLVGAIVLAVLHVRSLDQAIGVIEKKNDATTRINRKKIEAKLHTFNQAIEVKNTLKKEEDYAKKNELANKIMEMFSDNALALIRENLEGNKHNGGGNQSRW